MFAPQHAAAIPEIAFNALDGASHGLDDIEPAANIERTGDTILKNITPNPILNADPLDPTRRFASLGEYLVSLARVRELAPTLIYTAHGGEVTDYEEYFFALVKHIQGRQQKVIKLIPKEGTTAWQMSQRLFPHVKDLNRFLAVSETIAHLDWGVMEGRLCRERREGVDEFTIGL